MSSVKASSQASWVASQPKASRSANHSRVSYGSKDKRSTSRVRLVKKDTVIKAVDYANKLLFQLLLLFLPILNVAIDILFLLFRMIILFAT